FTCVRLLDTLFQSAEQNFPGLAGSLQRHYDESMSTEGSHNVRITECAFQGICSADQREISLLVPIGIIDLLQTVNVTVQQQKALRLSARQLELLHRGGKKPASVVQAG